MRLFLSIKSVKFFSLFIALLFVSNVYAQNKITVQSFAQQGAFSLVKANTATPILVDTADATVVSIAAKAVATDIELICNTKPNIINSVGNNRYLIIVGTIGQSAFINELVKSKKLNISKIEGKWESYSITTIDAPMKGVAQALVIAGSDKRGTAYGLFELSRAAGVSPWVWWADALPNTSKELFVLPANYTSQEPSVKFRGIFLNDEDWGLQPWAAKTFEPETGDIGPKTYSKIFELLLRLNANLIWPAMHDCTKAFFSIKNNTKVAEDYAIVIGSSHAEPMLRNNVGEWNEKTMGHFNYVTNKPAVYKYWEDRVKESVNINAMYSMGMRGVHDSKMEGVKDNKEAVPLLETIIKDQRDILTKNLKKDILTIPQVFTAYKEVLDIYDNGLKLPEDITLVWPDDNYGYIQRLNNQQEAARSGGSGVYYHASYWGRPHDYLWLSTTNPALMQEEMMKAFSNNSNRLWVLNVGDIKPLEYNTQLFLDMAYNAEPFKNNGYNKTHLQSWSTEIFGKEKGKAIQPILSEYYQLAFERRPEFMGWSQTEPTTKTNYTAFNHFFYGDEAQKRIDRYEAIERQVKLLKTQLSPKDVASFYQLVYYPVVGASLMNKKFLYRDKSYLYARQNRLSAADYAQLSVAAYDSIVKETDYYNNQLMGGKWKNMMSMKPRALPVYQAPSILPVNITPTEGFGISPEGLDAKDSTAFVEANNLKLPCFDNFNNQQYFVDVFLKNSQSASWVAAPSASWITISTTKGQLEPIFGNSQTRLKVSIDWTKVPALDSLTGNILFTANGKTQQLSIAAHKLKISSITKTFIENNGYIAINAINFAKQIKKQTGEWYVLPSLGYTGNALATTILPLQQMQYKIDTGWVRKNSSLIEYNLNTFSYGKATITVFSVPTHPLNNAFSMRYAVSVDNGPLQIIDFKTVNRSEEWKQNVLRNRAEKKLTLANLTVGSHSLQIYSIDPGVLLDAILIDLGGLKPVYGAVGETK